jgi:hypothetical protein
MDELDFAEALADVPVLRFRKTASKAEAVKHLIADNAVPLVGAAISAATIVGMQYAANKTDKSGTSPQQRISDAAIKTLQRRIDAAKAKGEEPDFPTDLAHSAALATKNFSDTLARHPKKGALLYAPFASGFGWNVAKGLQKIK